MTLENFIDLLQIFGLIFVVPCLIAWWVARDKKTETEKKAERAEKEQYKLDDLFLPNTEFCPICLTHEYWWTGGGSWSPDRCPYHRKSDDAILWKNMSKKEKRKAAVKFMVAWYRKYQTNYFDEAQTKVIEKG